jgi:FAD/FMN-containing dehydrogenase
MSIQALIDSLPEIAFITDAALVRQRSRDFFWYSPVLKRQLNGVKADAIAVPKDEAEVIRVMAACHARRIPVTPRGAGTGNYGQAMPLKGGVVLDLSAMDRVIWAKPGVLRAQAGAKLIAIDEQTRREVGGELRFHPSTKRTATLGGFIAGGSAGAGSCMWGSLREPGNILGLRVVTMEAEPRVLELRGAEIDKANHAYGTNGVITEVEVPLAPAHDWVDVMLGFPTLMDAARFADALTRADGIVKKLACVVAAPVPQQYFKAFEGVIPPATHLVLAMVAAPFLEALPPYVDRHSGRELHRCPTDQAAVPLYEHSWNHTTLQALKVDRSITYLQTLFPPPGHLALVEKMAAMFGDEVPMHLEFVRFGGEVACFGLQLVRYTTEERLAEIIRTYEENGCPIFNPHAFTLEEGGMKRVDARQLAFKKEADPLGLLNPGKMLAWDDPDWTPGRARTHYMFGNADAPEVEDALGE